MVSVVSYPCTFCIALSMDLFVFLSCIFDGVCELFGETMVFHRMWVLCLWSQSASRCSFHMFCLCFCMSEVISSFRSLRTGSQVFALLMLFLFVILHTMSSGKSLQLICIFPFGILCLSAISMMFVKILLAVCILVGMVVCAKADCVCREFCPGSFLVVGECPL